jgi:acetyltransferase
MQHDRQGAARIIEDCLKNGKTHIGELEGIGLLKCYGFNVLPNQLAKNAGEAAALAEDMGYPVVLKIVSAQILHKSDAGGVELGLENSDDVIQAFDKIITRAGEYDPAAKIEGVLVQKMASPGSEVILGLNRYPVFGPLLMVGIGGIFVEVFQDVVFRLAPIGRNEARRMVRQIRGYRLFQGFRGRPQADVETIERSLVSLSHMANNHPEIMELDINPLLVHARGHGATAADCRIILKKPENQRPPADLGV